MPLKHDYPWNVLVFPAASEIGLEICRALRDSKEVILYGANQPKLSAADFYFRRLYALPSIYEPNCLSELQKLITEHNIDAIFPAHDDVVLWLANHAKQLATAVITSPLETAQICRSKRETCRTLQNIVPVSTIFDPDTDIQFPVFVRPDKGQGSHRAQRVDDRETLEIALSREPDLIIAKYLPGREYTIDCFSQRGRGVLYAGARTREHITTGITSLGRTTTFPEVRTWAENIATKLDLHGAWFFQIKEDAEGNRHLLEVAPRIAGSMAQNRVMGPNFPLLCLYEAAGHNIEINAWQADIPMNRSLDVKFIYDQPIDALYIDLDDTLLVHTQVNTRLMALIFQCRNQNIPVNLITKHRGQLEETLIKFRLQNLFDSIFHIPNDATLKSNLIKEKYAVLIDDSFGERQLVSQKLGIRCFDAAAAICLLDERA